jgi:heme/copper-type cytochrome/quinol oxidase subunit 4
MPPAPAAPPARQPVDRSLMISAGLAVLVVGLTVLALAVEENDQRGYEQWTTWAIFATVMAAVHLVPLVMRNQPRRTWDIVAIATAGLVFYWVALILPFIGNATSFAQTLAVACALAHLWLLPGRR